MRTRMGAMRIVAVEPMTVEVPMREPVKPVHGMVGAQRSGLVRVRPDSGLDGWGNVDPSPGYTLMSADDIHATVASLAPVLHGLDPANLHVALEAMDRAVEERWEAKA